MHQSLIQKMKIATTGNRLISGGCFLLRRLTTAAEGGEVTLKKSLYKMVMAIKPNSSNKVSDLLDRLKMGNIRIERNNIDFCVNKLRKSKRPHARQNCLEIMEWMEKVSMNFSERECVSRLGLTRKIKGLDEAERYFDGLPTAMKNHTTYAALFNCYCIEKKTDKALATFEKMNEMNVCDTVDFNNFMHLYMKVGQPEKVPPLVEEMKRRNIPLSDLSYRIWFQSYESLGNVDGFERVVDKIEQEKDDKNKLTMCRNLAVVYVKVGQSEKAEAALKKYEEVLDNSDELDRGAFNCLISLCADVGNLEFVTRVWNKFKSKVNFFGNRSYLTMFEALAKLEDMEGLKLCLKEWESRCLSYDIKLPEFVIDAYLKKGMVEEAELLLKNATERVGRKIQNGHLSVANCYLGKRQVDSALRHMKLASDSSNGKLFRAVIKSFFKYFINEKDVDGAEEICRVLKEAQPLPLHSKIYMQLLRTYEAANKTAPDMRQRMEKDGVIIGIEHEELLKKVCPN